MSKARKQRYWRVIQHSRTIMFAFALLNLVPAAFIMAYAPWHPVLAVFNAAEWAATWACFEAGFTAKARKLESLSMIERLTHEFEEEA